MEELHYLILLKDFQLIINYNKDELIIFDFFSKQSINPIPIYTLIIYPC